MNDHVFFEQENLWGQTPERYQSEVKTDLIDILPQDIRSILDVGCGDGFITNALSDHALVIGLDISRSALKFVTRERIQGSILDIPLKDGACDLVMANDLLEHLEPPLKVQALRELTRVSSKYVIITVPIFEDLNAGMAKCADCGKYFHINHHLVSFDPNETKKIIDREGFHCVRQIITGDQWNPQSPGAVFAKKLLLIDLTNSNNSICPHCGATETVKPHDSFPEIERIGSENCTKEQLKTCYFRRTECINLYSRSDLRSDNPLLGFIDNKGYKIQVPSFSQNHQHIDFTKEVLFRKTFLPKYSFLPYYVCDKVSDSGVALNEGQRLCCGFFYYPHDNEKLILKVSGTTKNNGNLLVSQFKDNFGYCTPKIIEVAGDFSVKILFTENIVSEFGILFEFCTDSENVIIKTADLDFSSDKTIKIFHNTKGIAKYWRDFDQNIIDLSLHLFGEYFVDQVLISNLKLEKQDVFPILSESNYTSLSTILQVLRSIDITLGKEKDALTARYETLQTEKARINEEYETLRTNKIKLGLLYSTLQEDKAELERSSGKMKNDYIKIIEKQVPFVQKIKLLETNKQNSLKNRIIRFFQKFGKGKYEPDKSLRYRILKKSEPTQLPKVKDQNDFTLKKFLMICHDQNIDRRIIQEANLLQKRGWKGTIIALSFDNNDAFEYIEGIFIHRIGLEHVVPDCPTYWRYQNRMRWINWWGRLTNPLHKINWIVYGFDRVIKYWNFSAFAPLPFDYAFYNAGKHYRSDLVEAHDLPSLKTASQLSEKWGVPLIYDAHELYYEQNVFSRVQKKMMTDLERKYIHKCSAAFTVNESIAQEMCQRYQCPKPYVLVNAIDQPAGFNAVEKTTRLREYFSIPESSPVILYQGGLSFLRNLENLAVSMKYIKNPDAVLIFMGDGPAREVLGKIVEKNHLSRRVFFKEAVPQSELLSWTASADIGVIPYPPVDLNSYLCTPNKLFEYMQAGLPMVANDLPELNRFVKEIGFGWTAQLKTPKKIAQALDEALSNPKGLQEIRTNLLQQNEKYTWTCMSRIYMSVINDVMKNHYSNTEVK